MFEIHPPDYPLNREAFVAALANGHGRALIHANRYGVKEFRTEILTAATRPAGYDTQVDGFGEWRLAKLCEAAGLVGEIIDRDDDDDDVWLRCALLKRFFLNGHAEGLPALYAMWSRHREGRDLPAVEELISLEGERGLLFVAAKMGELLAKDNGFWVYDAELWLFDQVHGAGAARRILDREALTDPRIGTFLAGVDTTLTRWSGMKESPRPRPVDEVMTEIRTATRRYPRLQIWGREAADDDRRQVAEFLGLVDDPVVLAKALSCFAGTGFPVFDPAFLAYLQHSDGDVRSEVVAALSHHAEAEVRTAGREAIRSGDGWTGLRLLRKAARAEDLGEIFRAVEMPPDEDVDIHSIVSALVDLLEDNLEVWDARLPLWVYERSPCMHCRGSAVKSMIRQDECPRWVAEECAFDAYERLRTMVAGKP
jgi:hypothetical protein